MVKLLKNIPIFFLILISIYLFTFIFPNRIIFGEITLENYGNSFLENLEKESDIIDNFISDLNKFNSDDEISFSDLQLKIGSYRKSLNSFSSSYNDPPLNSPNSLKSAARDACNGTNKIIEGLRKMDLAIDSEDSYSFKSEINLINEGIALMQSAGKNYNLFVDEYNVETNSVTSNFVNNTNNTDGQNAKQLSSEPNLLADITLKAGIPLLGLFFYLLFTGLILNKNFNNKLSKIVEGNLKATNFKSTGIYGFHLIILFIFVYALLLFSFVLLADFIYLGIQFPISIIGLAIVAIGTIWALLKGIFGKYNKNIYGVLTQQKEYPEIWILITEVANKIGTKPPDEIYISPFYGIAVMSSGGIFHLLSNRTKRILLIDANLIKFLSTSELSAVLAHEFGHFNNKDTRWNSLTFSMGYALQNTLSSIPSPWSLSKSGCIIKIISILNPVLWIMGLSWLLYAILTNGFSRMREVFADKTAIQLYGSKSFVNGLMKVARSNYYSANLSTGLVKDYDDDKIDQLIFESEKSSIFDTHPLLKDRVTYAKYFD